MRLHPPLGVKKQGLERPKACNASLLNESHSEGQFSAYQERQ